MLYIITQYVIICLQHGKRCFFFINKTKTYERDLKKIISKHKVDELEKIMHIESLIKSSSNIQKLISSSLSKIYGIEKKKGDLKEIYTAKVNNKIRLYLKSEGEYPYDLVSIESIEFVKIDDKHYGEG